MTDYAHTLRAAQNRYAKAQELAAWLWAAGVTAAQLDLWTDDEWRRAAQSAVGRAASDDTRLVVYGMMIVKEAWAAAHPTEPDARRRVLSDEDAAALVAPGRRPRGAGRGAGRRDGPEGVAPLAATARSGRSAPQEGGSPPAGSHPPR